jgi:beta-phosphoglucomutase-like phosphatase (HAD superfamily)
MSDYQAVLFDMDGVLIDAREWHYLALNEALAPFGYHISDEDHHSRFDGLSTRRKLQILSEEEGLPTHLHSLISNVKQDRTLRFSSFLNYPSVGLQILLSRLSQKNITTGVVTNSIRETTEVMLTSAGIINHFKTIVTNEDVTFPKPDPAGYTLACTNIGIEPSRVLVIEDGDYGAKAATDAGCTVIRVSGPHEVKIGLLLPLLPELL